MSGERNAPERLLSPVEASRRLGVTVKTLYQWRSRRVGPAYYVLPCRGIRYAAADLEQWLETRRVG